MHRNVLKGLGVILGVLFLYGCASTEGVKVRRYVEVKDRVDQNMEEGNAGFLSGTPKPEDRSLIRKTRKIYVLEVSKDAVTADRSDVVIEDNRPVDTSGDFEDDIDYDDTDREDSGFGAEDLTAAPQDWTTEEYVSTSPETEEIEEPEESSPSFVEYKVLKDDTLQKISKKFYDSYSKWPRIYEANKDVIANPDRVKSGIVIQIPMD